MVTKPSQRKTRLQVSDDFFTTSWEPSEQEVVMVILRSGQKVLLLTKEWYPKGLFRLPSGRIKPGETVQQALKRELKEETSLELEIIKPLGVITCEIHAPSRKVTVTSHIFLLDGKSKELSPQDKKERIAAFKEIEIEELKAVAENLNSLKGELKDWGKFRAIAHQFVFDQLATIQPRNPNEEKIIQS